MFFRAGSGITRKLFRSLRVETLTRLPDTFPVLSCPLTAPPRCTRTPPPGVTVNLTRVRSYSRNGRGQMPKKTKTAPAAAAAAQPEASGPVCRHKSGCVTITVQAKPGSRQSAVTDVSAEAVGVSIAAPPTDGEANTELIRFLAEVLDLKKSRLSLDKGSRSRDKLIRVDSSLSPEEVLRRLRQAAG